jgi:NAD(P)-dependent dehydrogenase (short-subunit alcohol dehydrogenase family)
MQNNTQLNGMETTKRLTGKVAIITGAGSGIGAATALLFAWEGAQLLITDVRENALAEIMGRIKQTGGTALPMVQDVADEKQWNEVVAKALSIYGKIDILVNNAGVTGNLLAPMDQRTLEEFNRVISINLTSIFLGTKAVTPYMQAGAAIVNISSIAGITGNAGGNAYTASKGGSRMFSKGAAIELAPKGIRVNSVHPGYVETAMVQHMEGSDAFREMALGSTPLKRGAQPAEIAKGILFLASDDSSFVTGAELVMDGGFTAF